MDTRGEGGKEEVGKMGWHEKKRERQRDENKISSSKIYVVKIIREVFDCKYT